LNGPYDVIQEEPYLSGYVCGEYQTAAVWRPKAKKKREKFPLISFAHAWTQGGKKIHVYDTLMNGLASTGYVVVANMSGPWQQCPEQNQDQIRSIQWAKSKRKFRRHIDWSK
jgi:hypothetical protein